MKLVSGFEAASNLAPGFAIEARQRFFFTIVLFHDVVLRNNRIVQQVGKGIKIEGVAGVHVMAYRQEYLTNIGEMKDLRAQAKEKQCALPDLYTPDPHATPGTTHTPPTPPPGRKRPS